MLIEIPDYMNGTIAAALLMSAAVELRARDNIVPAFIHQYAEVWDRGLNGGRAMTFWDALAMTDTRLVPLLIHQGLIEGRT